MSINHTSVLEIKFQTNIKNSL